MPLGGAAGPPGFKDSTMVKGKDGRVLVATLSPPICLVKLIETFLRLR